MSESPESWLHQPLAIIGMDCRLPGADGLEQFWQLLVQGGYAVQRMPDTKLDRRLYFDTRKAQRGKTYSDVGGFVRERELDWSLLNIPPEEASQWDACHLNLCEVAARACRNAGFDPLNLPSRKVGVFVGHSGGTTLGGDLAYRVLLEEFIDLLAQLPIFQQLGGSSVSHAQPDVASIDSNAFRLGLQQELYKRLSEGRPQRSGPVPFVDAGYASGLISRNFGLTGPHISVDAACASSLVALAIGAMSLASGQMDMAIVGGASYNKTDSLILFSAAQSCSADYSRPFDQDADGLISSEGYVAVIIKQLHRALADGDNIQAVIRGIGISSDGRGRSLWAPRHEGQSTAIRRAYGPGVDPASVQMIEAHATSTQVGDATEMEALAKFYGPVLPQGHQIAVGSVKSNIGHTLETAGLAGLLKAILSMQHGVIPPSINIQHPNESIPWHQIPFNIPTEPLAWPDHLNAPNPGQHHPSSVLPAPVALRRAAVNAFGIGGLNVHIVVDHQAEASPQQDSRIELHRMLATESSMIHKAAVKLKNEEPADRAVKSSRQLEPIAVVGRGLVVPGANCLTDYLQLLRKTDHRANIESGQSRSLEECVHRVAYEYDWRRHKVPPKQVAHANPLQFMLLEAAEQALGEAGLLDGSIHRELTAVVVGSIFGGDFGNSLFAGLRLPEWRDRLIEVLRSAGIHREMSERVANEYEEQFLKQYPALLDETGSFTSSTLASRIAKTFNLMGGAMAVDAGDVSGLAALKTGCWLLQSGAAQTVLCAAAQRALDRAALDNLLRCGRLPSDCISSRDNPQIFSGTWTTLSPNDSGSVAEPEGYAVGEGVVLLTLQRLSHARREGTPVLAVIDSVSLGCATDQLSQSVRNSLSTLESKPKATSSTVVGRLGIRHLDDSVLQGFQSAKVATETAIVNDSSDASHSHPVDWKFQKPHNLDLTGHLLGAQGLMDIINACLEPANPTTWIVGHTLSGQSGVVKMSLPRDSDPIVSQNVSTELKIGYWASNSLDDLKQLLTTGAPPSSTVDASRRFAAAVVASSQELPSKARKLAAMIGNPKAQASLIDQGMLWLDRDDRATSHPKIAYVFAGQGSQYPQMCRDLVDRFPVARQVMVRADSILRGMGQPSFAEMAWGTDNQLGENVWHTQASLLVADSMASEILGTLSIQPEVVCGHSYGEIPAMLTAGCLDLETALSLTWHRCRCVIEHASAGCSMMSIHSDEQTVARVIASNQLPITISHINAPDQTVVGGKSAHVAHLAGVLEERQIASRILPVPTAFHTPILKPSVEPFRRALDSIPINPPRIPLLSSVNNRLMADPDWIRDGLAQQLITPLRFVDLIGRLERLGVTHLIEVGPQRILTRLARASSQTLQVFSTDSGASTLESRLGPVLTLQALAHLLGLNAPTMDQPPFSSLLRATPSRPSMEHMPKLPPKPVIHFDATQVRKLRNRQQSSLLPREHQVRNAPTPQTIDPASETPPITVPQESPLVENNRNPQVVASHQMEQLLIDFVVEQTGYPAEIVELDADLEADLGIDSIKKAQLLGELRELFPQTIGKLRDEGKSGSKSGRAGGQRLAELRSLRDFVRLLSPEQEEYDNRQFQAEPATTIATTYQTGIASTSPEIIEIPEPVSQPVDSVATSSCSPQVTYQGLSRFVVDFVVEQTGYPAEIVELDADLEADLGIDSIKKAQLLGELRETFGLSLPKSPQTRSGKPSSQATPPSSRVQLDSLRTLRQILSLLADQLVIPIPEEVETTNLPEPATIQTTSGNVTADSLESILTQNSERLISTSQNCYRGVIPVLGSDFRNGFVDAVKKNLRTLSTRTTPFGNPEHSSMTLNASTSSSVDATDVRISRLALQANLSETCLASFDERVLSDSSWEIIAPGHGSSEVADGTHWFAEFRLPKWMAANPCQPIGIVEQADSLAKELVTPGCCSSLAIVNHHGIVMIASASSEVIRKQLSMRLQDLQTTRWQEIPVVIQSWTDLNDWWMLTAEPELGNISIYKCSGTVISTNAHRLSKWGNQQESLLGTYARIGWNSQGKHWVLSAQSGPLAEPVVSTLEVTSLGHSNTPVNECEHTPLFSDHVHHTADNNFFSGFSSVDLRGIDGQNLNQAQRHHPPSLPCDTPDIAKRYVLRMMPAPLLEVAGGSTEGLACQATREPEWSGAAVIIGDNPVARQLESRLRSSGVTVFRPQRSTDGNELELSNWFVELTNSYRLPHLFITSPCDSDAKISLDALAWQRRSQQGLMSVYWLCQKWLEHISHHQLADDASLIALSTLGGDFGLSGQLYSAEGGGINGLLKSMLIECWMQGIRTLPMKTIDVTLDQEPNVVVDCIWRELAYPSYDNEISYRGGVRSIVKAIPQPLPNPIPENTAHPSSNLSEITRGGTWVCTGGARGITALAVQRLAERYDLTVHLIGTAPEPKGNVDLASFENKDSPSSGQPLDGEELRQLKLKIMTEAQKLGCNPVKAWQDHEKQLEIQATVRRFQQLGIRAHYHSCDVSDRLQLSALLEQIRESSGPIRGVIHGAGVGRDSRFDRKQPDKVRQCIQAKVDGVLSLIASTWDDPLEVFVGFGSISGRFGANGHTDYSLANDMMCKWIDWLHAKRPTVRAVGFHWHAWGDVGMATKPETKLALEMINMQFMPAEEGVRHLIRELEADCCESEVLITDDRYYRAFYPAETLVQEAGSNGERTPLLKSSKSTASQTAESSWKSQPETQHFIATVHPTKDPFLAEHLLDGKPLLPFVIATEMIAEAAVAGLGATHFLLRNIQAHSPVKFYTESPLELHLFFTRAGDVNLHTASTTSLDLETCSNSIRSANIELRSDFVSQRGLIVDRQRLNFSAQALGSEHPPSSSADWKDPHDPSEASLAKQFVSGGSTRWTIPDNVQWKHVIYPELDSEFYVGWPLQKLRKFALLEEGLVGKISAPALIELAGVQRSTDGWIIPSAALDACLFAAGILAWNRIAPGSALPIRMGQLRLGRLPRPGEACRVHVAINSTSESSASFDFSLYGVDGGLILDCLDYQVAWLRRGIREVDQADIADSGISSSVMGGQGPIGNRTEI